MNVNIEITHSYRVPDCTCRSMTVGWGMVWAARLGIYQTRTTLILRPMKKRNRE